MICNYCECHLSFHESYPIFVGGLEKSLKLFGEKGCKHEDSCQHFVPKEKKEQKMWTLLMLQIFLC